MNRAINILSVLTSLLLLVGFAGSQAGTGLAAQPGKPSEVLYLIGEKVTDADLKMTVFKAEGRTWHVVMNNRTNIGLVDPHPERVGGDDHLGIALHEPLLRTRPFLA